MTKDKGFKSVVRRHAQASGQRYTEALADLTGLDDRLFHTPAAERLLGHLADRYGLDAAEATKVSRHNDHVFRIDRREGEPWIARVFPPARPVAGAQGDAAILAFLERQDYPAERLAVPDAVSTLDGASVLVTRFIPGPLLPSPAVGAEGIEKFAVMGSLLGRLHALPLDDAVGRPGGASGRDPRREGAPRQDVLAALAFLDAVDVKVSAETRARFDELRGQVRAADAGEGLPEALVHGDLLHAPDHVILGEHGPAAIHWTAAGRGPRLADVAYLMWGTWLKADWIEAAVRAYRRHVELTAEELDRLEALMWVRPLYLAAFGWRRSLAAGRQPTPADGWWSEPDPAYLKAAADAVRAAWR